MFNKYDIIITNLERFLHRLNFDLLITFTSTVKNNLACLFNFITYFNLIQQPNMEFTNSTFETRTQTCLHGTTISKSLV